MMTFQGRLRIGQFDDLFRYSENKISFEGAAALLRDVDRVIFVAITWVPFYYRYCFFPNQESPSQDELTFFRGLETFSPSHYCDPEKPPCGDENNPEPGLGYKMDNIRPAVCPPREDLLHERCLDLDCKKPSSSRPPL